VRGGHSSNAVGKKLSSVATKVSGIDSARGAPAASMTNHPLTESIQAQVVVLRVNARARNSSATCALISRICLRPTGKPCSVARPRARSSAVCRMTDAGNSF